MVNNEERPQCVFCNNALINDSMRSAKLKQHLHNVHPHSKDKDKIYIERQSRDLMKMRLDASGKFFTRECKIVEASYAVALEIAKQKKPHTIRKTLINPFVLQMADIMLGKNAERKLASVSLSNCTIQRRIKNLFDDIKCPVVEEIKTAPFGLLAIQINESTDISSCAQLMVFLKYVYNDTFKNFSSTHL